jgi:hypothetical protein
MSGKTDHVLPLSSDRKSPWGPATSSTMLPWVFTCKSDGSITAQSRPEQGPFHTAGEDSLHLGVTCVSLQEKRVSKAASTAPQRQWVNSAA